MKYLLFYTLTAYKFVLYIFSHTLFHFFHNTPRAWEIGFIISCVCVFKMKNLNISILFKYLAQDQINNIKSDAFKLKILVQFAIRL